MRRRKKEEKLEKKGFLEREKKNKGDVGGEREKREELKIMVELRVHLSFPRMFPV